MPNDRTLKTNRRSLLASSAAASLLSSLPFSAAHASHRGEPVRDIVLIHGAWHGAWCWDMVRGTLEWAGYNAHALTLPGLAERADEMSAEIGLQTHIDDAIAQITALELQDFVLVGHSYGGMVITGIADAMKNRISHIIYLDAALPKDGESMITYGAPRPPEVVAATEQALRGLAPDGIALPAFPPSMLGIPKDHKHYDWVAANLTPHPLKTWFDPISLKNGGPEGLPALYVLCTDPMLAQTQFPWVADQLKDKENWHVMEIATGHDIMITEPGMVASLIEKASYAPSQSRKG